MAAPPITTTVTELPESRVRVEAEVPAAEVEKRVEQAARSLGRPSACPASARARCRRRSSSSASAARPCSTRRCATRSAAGTPPPSTPRPSSRSASRELDLGELPGEGEPLTFSIEIGVRPNATLGEYKGLEVGKRDPAVADEAIDAELERLRERSGRLETVERAAGEGDFVVMDYLGSIDGEPFEGGEGRDQMIELGSGRLVPGFEEQLDGRQGRRRAHGRRHLPRRLRRRGARRQGGRVRRDRQGGQGEAAARARRRLRRRGGLRHARRAARRHPRAPRRGRGERVEAEFREAVLDAAVANATVEVPDALVEARARELWEQMLHSLSHQGISKEMYLQISGSARRRSSRRARRTPSAAQARGRARRGRRGRGDRALRRRGPRALEDAAPQEQTSPRSCSSACSPPAASTPSRRTSPPARRSTS